jgi:hypothetical protein
MASLFAGKGDAQAGTRRWMVAAGTVSGALGAKLGYDFGLQIGGAPLGLLLGANCAVFGWLMVGAATDAVLRFKRR